jgi:hypothetical protein
MPVPTAFTDPEVTWSFVTPADRAALMRKGVVVLGDGKSRQGRWVFVTGADRDRARVDARLQLGPKVLIDVVGAVPRHLVPRPCDGYMEREPGRLQLRYATTRSEHIDDVLVAEDEEAVVVFATVCTPVVHEERHLMESPHHVYLDRPLGGRVVFDGVTGREVPFKNVYDEIRASGLLDGWRSQEEGRFEDWRDQDDWPAADDGDPGARDFQALDDLDALGPRDYDDMHDVA